MAEMLVPLSMGGSPVTSISSSDFEDVSVPVLALRIGAIALGVVGGFSFGTGVTPLLLRACCGRSPIDRRAVIIGCVACGVFAGLLGLGAAYDSGLLESYTYVFSGCVIFGVLGIVVTMLDDVRESRIQESRRHFGGGIV